MRCTNSPEESDSLGAQGPLLTSARPMGLGRPTEAWSLMSKMLAAGFIGRADINSSAKVDKYLEVGTLETSRSAHLLAT